MAGVRIARLIGKTNLKLTAAGTAPDLHRCSLFIIPHGKKPKTAAKISVMSKEYVNTRSDRLGGP